VSTKTKAQLETELRLLRQSKATEGFVSTVKSAFMWATIGFIAYRITLILPFFAGQKTDANFSILANINVSVALAWGVGATGAVYGKYQQKLKRDTVERLQARIQELEVGYDPKRSTSSLPPRGDTRKEDEI
jgi:hypothetical protein